MNRSPRMAVDPCGAPDSALSTSHASGHGSASLATTCTTASTQPATSAGQYRRTCDANNGRITRIRCAVNFVMSSQCLTCVDRRLTSVAEGADARYWTLVLALARRRYTAFCRHGDLRQPAPQ